jgi:endonuclease YncB( thermonuclease family)
VVNNENQIIKIRRDFLDGDESNFIGANVPNPVIGETMAISSFEEARPMSNVNIAWDPHGFELNALGTNKFLGATDGDTPSVAVNIRMLSIDTPEVHYPGNQKPSRQDQPLAQLAEWIGRGQAPIAPELGAYLLPRLATGKAGTLQEEQGKKATEFFRELLKSKLTRSNGSQRRVYLRAADQPFDDYGRLLAYMAPSYTKQELAAMTRKERATFNLLMIESGWAASFPIYPSLPQLQDLELLQEAAEAAYRQQRGIWADPLTLAGYEFRMCVKLHEITAKLIAGQTLPAKERTAWISRHCLDMTTRLIYSPQDYFRVEPCNRIFVWPQDVAEAAARLNLTPAEA